MIKFFKWFIWGYCYYCGSSNTVYHDYTINPGMWDENRMPCYTECKDCGKTC